MLCRRALFRYEGLRPHCCKPLDGDWVESLAKGGDAAHFALTAGVEILKYTVLYLNSPSGLSQGRILGKRVHGVEHLNPHEIGQAHRSCAVSHLVCEHPAPDFSELACTLVEVRLLNVNIYVTASTIIMLTN